MKLFLFLLVGIFGLVLNHVITSHVNQIGHAYYQEKEWPLYDIAYQYLPEVKEVHRLFGCVGLPEVIPLVLFLLVLWKLQGTGELLSFMVLVALGFFVRVLGISMTIFPSAKTDQEKTAVIPLVGGCHDLTISGHTLLTALCSFYLARHVPRWAPVWYGSIAVEAVILLVYREHYSIDIVFGLLTALLLFTNRTTLFDRRKLAFLRE